MRIFWLVSLVSLISSCAYKVYERPSMDIAVYKTKVVAGHDGLNKAVLYRSKTQEYCGVDDACFLDKVAIGREDFDKILTTFDRCYSSKE